MNIKLKSKQLYDTMIASPPTIEYNNDFNQPNSYNFLQTNEVLNQQNDINQQGIDSNQIKFIVDPFNSPQYFLMETLSKSMIK